MNFMALSRLAPPPAPESPQLRRHRFLAAALMLISAFLVAFVTPITAIWKPVILLYPLIIVAAFVSCFLFFRRRARWQDEYWTEERRIQHYMKVAQAESRKRGSASAALPDERS